jgi:hypothetical protein
MPLITPTFGAIETPNPTPGYPKAQSLSTAKKGDRKPLEDLKEKPREEEKASELDLS